MSTWAAGTLSALAGWWLARRAAGAGWSSPAWLLLDAVPSLVCFGALLGLGGRPLLAGIGCLALGAGYAYADRAKRRVLAEPVVFTDVFQAFDIFRHPRLALPFPHRGRVVAVTTLAAALLWLLFHSEDGIAWQARLLAGLLAAGLLLATVLLATRLHQAAARYLSLQLSTDPVRDGAAHGPFAILLAYGMVARAERPARQARAAVAPARPQPAAAAPLVLVQCESFFDARRLHPYLRSLALPHFDQARRNGLQWGRLEVPSWGANTVRTEFAVLTGLEQAQLGCDRFNPYHRFARAPVASLAWRMRAAGYRTICLHPFDRTFYGRDLVMPHLGFERLIGEEAFAGAQRVNGYVADVEAARVAAEILREERGRVFLFIITMENHGPWPLPPPGAPKLLPAILDLPPGESLALESYLRSLRGADAMIGQLMDALRSYGEDGMLAFYGDHLPSFPATVNQLGLSDLRSDYALWRTEGGPGRRVDLAAHQLAAALLEAREAVRSPHRHVAGRARARGRRRQDGRPPLLET